jgi:hypothetical protein
MSRAKSADPLARVRDGEHLRLARTLCRRRRGQADQRARGRFAKVLPKVEPGYDVAFFDGHAPVPALHKTVHELLRVSGAQQSVSSVDCSVTGNVHVHRQSAGIPGSRTRLVAQGTTPWWKKALTSSSLTIAITCAFSGRLYNA